MRKILKILLGLIFGGAVVFGGSAAVTETQVAFLPQEEKFVVDSSRVIGYRDLPDVPVDVATSSKGQATELIDVVQYGYISERPSQSLEYEDISKRTEISVTQGLGATQQITFGDYRYQKVGDAWYDVSYATTTKEAYELQKKSVFPEVSAQTGSSTGTFVLTGTWIAPSGVTIVNVKAWGAGGGGSAGSNGSAAGTGGGGGGYSETSNISVTPGTSYTVTVGVGGAGGVVSTSNAVTGGDTSFNVTTVIALGGQGIGNGAGTSVGGLASGGTGTIKTSGGGNTQNATLGWSGGGGGGSGGNVTNGGDGSSSTGAAAPGTGGTAGTLNGAAGANGGNAAVGGTGNAPGGAGGGGQGSVTAGSRRNGGPGAAGQVVITFVSPSMGNKVFIGNGARFLIQNGTKILIP